MINNFFRIILIYLIITYVVSFSLNLIRSCEKVIHEGVLMMGKPIVFNNSFSIQVFDSLGVQLGNNSFIPDGCDILTVKIAPKLAHVVFEIRTGHPIIKFEGNYCNGTRSNQSDVKLFIYRSLISGLNSHSFVISGVWAKSYSSGVQITDQFQFYLHPGDAEDSQAEL